MAVTWIQMIIVTMNNRTILIKKEIYKRIINSFDLINEDGGILGYQDGVIAAFFFDKGKGKDSYQINVQSFSHILDEWENNNISFAGFIHSHVDGKGEPSIYDLIYLKKFMKMNDELDELLFPIVYRKNDVKTIKFFVFKSNEFIECCHSLVE